jgi:phage terminase small subunit
LSKNVLSSKQQGFVEEYLLDLNATKAAIRAGYSAKTADSFSIQLLRKTKVSSAIEKAKAARSLKTEITAEKVLSELACMAFYDPANLVSIPIEEPGDIKKLPETIRRSIVGWSWDKFGYLVLKLANKERALELIGKHIGMFIDRQTAIGDIDISIIQEDKP